MQNFSRFVWQQTLDSMQSLPSISEWEYKELYQPLWTTIPGLKFQELCFCNGQCWKHCCVLESAFYKLIFFNSLKHQLTKTLTTSFLNDPIIYNLCCYFWTCSSELENYYRKKPSGHITDVIWTFNICSFKFACPLGMSFFPK